MNYNKNIKRLKEINPSAVTEVMSARLTIDTFYDTINLL